MNSNIIEITGLGKTYGSQQVVEQLNLGIKEGEVFGLLGPNGAGKTTTIRMILGLTEPSSGKISVCGLSSTQNPIEVKQKVGYLPEDVGFYNNMTGFENLLFTARLNRIAGIEARIRVDQLLEMVGLTNEAGKKTGAYSRGMKQRLGLADVLIKQPQVIILDEPTLGLDPNGVKELLNLIVRLSKKEGITVLFSSHHLHQVQQVCDRIGLFVKGRLIAEGEIGSLSGKLFSCSPVVIEAGIGQRMNGSEGQDHDSDQLINEVIHTLKEVESVTDVKVENSRWYIECKKDLTEFVAKTIVEGGLGLISLAKKEYGLDDIYYRYFEGGENHEA